MTLFRKKFRVEPARLPQWDYASPGAYFITICAKNRKQYFGGIINGKLELSETGMIADTYWREIPNHFPKIRLDHYVIMPNHIHGILEIIPVVETPKLGVSKNERNTETPGSGVSTMGETTTMDRTPTIGIIINQFKRMCTLTMKKHDASFGWQSRFHDHIIRNDRELFAIRQYIRYNPANWDSDRDVIETRDAKTGKQPWFVYMG